MIADALKPYRVLEKPGEAPRLLSGDTYGPRASIFAPGVALRAPAPCDVQLRFHLDVESQS